MDVEFIFDLPLWAVCLVTLSILFVAFESGFLLGRHRGKRSDKEKESPVGPMVAATLGLLAFMLAFTFGAAASHFNTRRQLVLEEATAIRSAHAMAGLLADEPCAESRALLRQYVDIRLEGFKSLDEVKVAIDRSNDIQDGLWSIAMTGEAASGGASSSWLYVQSLCDMFALQTKRVHYGTHRKVQLSIWVALYWLAILSMAAMGYHAGLTGKRGFFAYLVLVFTFSLVMVLIYDLDRPKQSFFKVSQRTLTELQQRMAEPALKD